MINLKISIGFGFILNNTEEKWHTFQDQLQDEIDKTPLHLLPEGEMKDISGVLQHPKDKELYYRFYVRFVRDDRSIQIAIIEEVGFVIYNQ